MSEKALLIELIDEVKKTNELLEEIQASLDTIDRDIVGTSGDIKRGLEAIQSRLTSIETSRKRKPYV